MTSSPLANYRLRTFSKGLFGIAVVTIVAMVTSPLLGLAAYTAPAAIIVLVAVLIAKPPKELL